ncbi:hypothetical protein HPB51_012125 [Rhipicephalus microplus]|uniref:Uncharacterized protein n=1 Tax=Rhipicephalus microplus TaxID=6941 RepID=A0A9J6DUG9_RHIMP|nr:hypothetical protein HPB51_012125 [Rhipicephalus microplus]
MPFFRLRSALSSSHRTGRRRKKDSLPATMTFKDFTRADDDIVSCAEATDDEILRQVVPEPESGSDDDNDDRPQPSAAEIANAVTILSSIYGDDVTLAQIRKSDKVTQWTHIFYLAASVSFVGGVVFAIYGSAERQPWADPGQCCHRQASTIFSAIELWRCSGICRGRHHRSKYSPPWYASIARCRRYVNRQEAVTLIKISKTASLLNFVETTCFY